MAKTKFRRIEQQKTFTHREQYENALTRERAKNRAKSLSYVEIDIGDGEMANVYFTPMPGSLLKLREVGLDYLKAYHIIIDTLANHVVDPAKGEPIMTAEEWEAEDPEFVNKVTSAVMGIQFVSNTEAENVPEGELLEIDEADLGLSLSQAELEEIASDPNPLDETAGSNSLTTSTASLESEDQQSAGAEETSKNG